MKLGLIPGNPRYVLNIASRLTSGLFGRKNRFIQVIHKFVTRLHVPGSLGKAIQLVLGRARKWATQRLKVEL